MQLLSQKETLFSKRYRVYYKDIGYLFEYYKKQPSQSTTKVLALFMLIFYKVLYFFRNTRQGNCFYRCWILWIRFCRAISDFIERIFEKHTRFITKHHSRVIIGCFAFVALSAIGAVWFTALQRNEELFIPQGKNNIVNFCLKPHKLTSRDEIVESLSRPTTFDDFIRS